MTAQSMFDKIWRAHEVVPESTEAPAILYIDLHLAHEVTSPQAFSVLRERGVRLRRPDRTLATLDHATPTDPRQVFGGVPIRLESAARQIEALERNAVDYGVELFGLRDSRRGIVHVIGPELGLTQPGMTIACGDSHTSTHGAFGTFAFGIGTTEVGHVFATQCLLQRRPKTLAIDVRGRLGAGVSAKDLVLAIIGQIGVAGGSGHVIEYRGPAIRALSMDERMTVCNMSIEAGARAGMIAPDATTFEYLRDRPRAPAGADWERAIERWRALASDEGSAFDRQIDFDASAVEPMISYGTNPGMVMPIGARIPGRDDQAFLKSLHYMGFQPGDALAGRAVDVVFIGSCTNSRLSDLRVAAAMLRGRRVASGVRMLIVPGSQQVKQAAEAEGLHEVFTAAGAEWRESGCSMCVGINGDTAGAGRYVVSTSNRNFEGRQGQGARTLLASPATAAAAAITGRITDPREFAS
jgi:3-isopropylmalate/(R)-2-methylmalate dehydratase large subunit